jgi:integrase
VSVRNPSYRLHKPSGQAVVTINGQDVYLGKHGSAESRLEYDRILAEWLTNGRQPSTSPRKGRSSHDPTARSGDLTVNEMVLGFIRFAEGYYRKGGRPTGEATNIKYALRHLRRLYGHTLVGDFGPLALKAVRQDVINSGLCRNEVNRRTRIIVRCFKWAVENELVPATVHHGLKTVSGLRKGRSEARESEPVTTVPDEFVIAIASHVSRQVWAMVQVQRLAGMRPGEVCIMRACDLDTSASPWIYTPETHKGEHHDRDRTIYLGPAAQALLRPWLRADLSAYLFQPREAVTEMREERRKNRQTPPRPSKKAQVRKKEPKKAPGVRYTTDSYRNAVVSACEKAGIPPWHPNQLRHNAATMLRKEFGLDAARVILGHSSPAVTEIYAEVDREKAMVVMERVG